MHFANLHSHYWERRTFCFPLKINIIGERDQINFAVQKCAVWKLELPRYANQTASIWHSAWNICRAPNLTENYRSTNIWYFYSSQAHCYVSNHGSRAETSQVHRLCYDKVCSLMSTIPYNILTLRTGANKLLISPVMTYDNAWYLRLASHIPYFIVEAPTCFDSYNQPRKNQITKETIF